VEICDEKASVLHSKDGGVIVLLQFRLPLLSGLPWWCVKTTLPQMRGPLKV